MRRRQARLAHWRAWHASGIRAISEVRRGRSIPSRRDPSHSQTLLCGNLERGYVDVGRPPDDLTAAGALGELCGLRVGCHDDVCGLRVPLMPGLAALPRAASKPIDTVSCLPPEARGLDVSWRHSLLRDPKESELLWDELGLVRPFSFPLLVGRAARYSEFLHQASQKGVIDHSRQVRWSHSWHLLCCQENEKFRVLIDTRCVNVLFRELDHTAFPTAPPFNRLEAPSKGDLFNSQGDLEKGILHVTWFSWFV